MYCPLCGTPNNDDATQCVKCSHNFQAGVINPAPPAALAGETLPAPVAMPPAPSYPPPSYPAATPYPPAHQYPPPAAHPSQSAPQTPAAWQEQPGFSQAPLPQQWAQSPVLPAAQGQMPPGQGNDAFGALIPYKNSSALIAYYLAVFSLIPCFGLILGIAAFVLGLQGLKFAKLHPEAKGVAHAWVGIILGGLCGLANILIIVVPMILAASSR